MDYDGMYRDLIRMEWRAIEHGCLAFADEIQGFRASIQPKTKHYR